MIDEIQNTSNLRIKRVSLDFKRSLFLKFPWKNRMTGIIGTRGVGKTTMILQYLKENYQSSKEAVYASLDDLFFTNNTLLEYADYFSKHGGKYLFLDEVHKYPNWSQELKNIYDRYPDLNIVFTSSSALDIHKGSHDLSRRTLIYKLPGLSFREYIEFNEHIKFPVVSIKDLFNRHLEIADGLNEKIKPIPLFEQYMKTGYYPYYIEDIEGYYQRIKASVNRVIETDLPAIHNIEFYSVMKLKKLLVILASMVPFKPNIEKLSGQIGTTRDTLLRFLYYLDKAGLIKLVTTNPFGINYLNKPDKIFLDNANLFYALNPESVNAGSLRETFFVNQTAYSSSVTIHQKADFLVDKKYTVEVGGSSKTKKQISGIENSFIAADNLEYGAFNKIPLWLFGFLY